jgi:Fe-S cluster biogenesis protein NfuA
MSFYIHIQDTPNPNAAKFISRYTVKTEGKSNYHNPAEASGNELARQLFGLPGVTQVFFFDNYITVSKDPTVDWNELGEKVVELLQEKLPEHDPNYVDESEEEEVDRSELSEEVLEIEEVLDDTIRPALAADGGGIQVVERKGDTVYIKYEGACGSCPSAFGGTMMAIQSVLRDEISPDIEIIDVGGGMNAPGMW